MSTTGFKSITFTRKFLHSAAIVHLQYIVTNYTTIIQSSAKH